MGKIKNPFFARNLRHLRKKLEMRQWQLATLVPVSECLVIGYESGKGEPGIQNLIRIAEILKVSIDDLVTKDLTV